MCTCSDVVAAQGSLARCCRQYVLKGHSESACLLVYCICDILMQMLHGAVQVAKVAVVVGLTALATDKLQKEYVTRKVTTPSPL